MRNLVVGTARGDQANDHTDGDAKTTNAGLGALHRMEVAIWYIF